MRQKPIQDKKSAAIDKLLRMFYTQAKAQFGDAVQDYWFYDSDLCPACTQRSGGAIKYKGRDALSLNAFIYWEKGILIGYFLCEICAGKIFRAAKINPYQQTPLHNEIECNLIAAYHDYVNKLTI
jgi:hypothetical protein